MPQPLLWTMLKSEGDIPASRYGHSFTKVGTSTQSQFVLFGGVNGEKKDSKILPKNDVYLAIANKDTVRWAKKTATGDIPLPRAQHLAIELDKDNILIFGGIYNSKTRLNDVVILNIQTMIWRVPSGHTKLTDPKNESSTIGGPDPRASCGGCILNKKLYIFGGLGGSYFTKRVFNDLYELDLTTFKWSFIDYKNIGRPPDPRCGHSMFANNGNLYIFGGWNNETQYSTISVFTFEKLDWLELEIPTSSPPRWNHSGIVVDSIPSQKYFYFGGMICNENEQRGVGDLSSQTYCMDLKKFVWEDVKTEDEKKVPSSREHSAIAYDKKEARLLVFGGWHNNYLNDIYSLNISSIVGPPYAIESIEPRMGQLSGNTKVVIKGVGFSDTINILVSFRFGKQGFDVPGTFVDNDIACVTPSFESIGPKEVDVKVRLRENDFTITSCKFTYFMNTRAHKCLAYGPGLLEGGKIGEDIFFVIQARNELGENRKSGKDKFEVIINQEGIDAAIPATIEDKDDGTYLVKYKVDKPNKATVIINFENDKQKMEAIRGNPFKALYTAEAPSANNNMTGPLMISSTTKELNEIDTFLKETLDGSNIKGKSINEDVKVLLKIQEHIQNADEKSPDYQLKLDVLEESLNMLQKANIPKSAEIKKLQLERDQLTHLTKQVREVKKEIAAPFTQQSEFCIKVIKEYEDKTKQFLAEIKKMEFCQFATGVVNSLKKIEEIKETIKQHDTTLKDLSYNAMMFKFPTAIEASQKNIDQAKIDMDNVKALWNHIKTCNDTFDSFLATPWVKTMANEMEEDVKKLFKKLKNEIKVDPKLNVYSGMNDLLKEWTNFLPLVTELRDESMRPRHWEILRKKLDKKVEITEQSTLMDMWNLKLIKIKETVEEIGDQAKQEAKMEKFLDKLEITWKKVDFDLVATKTTGVNTLKMGEDNFDMLEEHMVSVQNMKGSKFLATFETRVTHWEKSLAAVSEVVQALADVQRLWSYLENLFIHSEEVKKELPKQAEQFVGIDKEVKEILKNGETKKNILIVCTENDIFKRLEKIQSDLGVCEKALNEFLDGKRRAFPRFYFVSPADLLDILANGNNPPRIQMHMTKIFQAIDHLELKEIPNERPSAVGMHSSIGVEYVDFDTPLKLEGKVEKYLDDTINTMRSSLRKICGKSLENSRTVGRDEWLKMDAAQITMIVNQMMWVTMVESTFIKLQGGANTAMKETFKKQVDNLNLLIKMVQGQLDKPLRQKVMVMITMDTHNRDMIDKLDKECVKKSDDFQWQAQLKHVWDSEQSTCRIDIVDAKFIYAYEYYGNCPRLVITPLTDRIYVTAAQALHLKMGCAPAGPAGTGKTETVKDLSSANAKPCYVYNCSPEMDYRGMGNIYKGLAASGAWGCFDEFNRLMLEVLSVCSVQFKEVIDAIKAKKTRFTLQDDEINLDSTCGVFITMNPGYLGRSELPESLKTLFRPITVVVPDFELICENMLMAEGFLEAKVLAHKFICLYALCRDLLSKQSHYDWGMRAIKSVLVVAGGFKRAEPELAENKLLMRALRDFNLPKIVADDLDVFMGLLSDLFPGLDVPRKRNMKFEDVIVDAAKELKYYPDPQFVLKIVQLYELLEIRHCVFIMGLYGSGKTATWRTLAKAQDKDQKKTTYIDINPKSINTNELYGYLLPTKEWKDGVLSKNLRDLGRVTDSNPKWLVLDGDIDANWIESMNSVMDDNKMLTLASNERIPLKAHMRMLFELRDLLFASPATVSRAGILYISDPGGYQWKAYFRSWLSTKEQPPADSKDVTLEKLFDKYLQVTIDELKKHYKFILPITDISLVAALCKMLDGLLTPNIANLEYIFVFALIWAVGGGLCKKDQVDYKKNFSAWWKNTFKTVKFPSSGTIFDYYVEKEKSSLEEWSKLVKIEPYDDVTPINEVTIETVETVRATYFMELLVKVNHYSLLVGNAGCGKSAICKGLLNKLITQFSDTFIYNNINFNYYTDSPLLQPLLERPLEKKAGIHFAPPGKLKLIYYIDDLNMPMLDLYNTQTAIELMRQYADYGHWFDRSKLTLKKITDALFLCSMNPTAGSLYINPRLQRHFWLLNIEPPEENSLFAIYNTFMIAHFKRFKPLIQEQITPLIKAEVQLHQRVSDSFKKTAINFHYDFNIRHVANIFQGLVNVVPEKFTDPEKLVKLWIHEANRLYGDRLVTEDDLKTYKDIIGDTVKKCFTKYNLQKYFTKGSNEILIFTSFVNGLTDRSYDQFTSQDQLDNSLKAFLNDYNDTNAAMDLVLFGEAMKHVCRIARIITNPSGHALLVGVGGSGKQSLSKLASFICQYTTIGIVISSTYGMTDLKNDLQVMYKKAGEKDDGVMFLFTDGQISNERFLVYINDLLSTGEIAELYTSEEKDTIVNLVRPAAKSAGLVDSKDNCWNFYIKRIKKNLHTVICFSPVGENFRNRSRKFPALINSTVIDWFQKWPQDALQKVAEKFLHEEEMATPEIKASVIQFMPFSFNSVNEYSQKIFDSEKRYVYTTPKSFLELIKLFKSMYTNRKKELEDAKQRYEEGVIKLKVTGDEVAKLEADLKIKSVEVEAVKKEAVEKAAVVSKNKEYVEGESKKAEAEADTCAKIQKSVEEKKSSVQRDLDSAEPIVQKALSALKKVDINDFRNLKALASPAAQLKNFFSCLVNILANTDKDEKEVLVEVDKNGRPKDIGWGSAKKMMANPQHLVDRLGQLKDMISSNSIPPQNFNANKGIMSDPEFNRDKLGGIHKIMFGLFDWLDNMTNYYTIYTSIEPKRLAVAQATEELRVASEKKAAIDAIVAKLRADLKILIDEYNITIAAKEKAESEAARCQKRLDMAQRLVKALGSENERWNISIGTVSEKIGLLVGDVLISSAFVSYIGPFTKKYRAEIMKYKFMEFMTSQKIPMSPDPNPLTILSSDAEMAQWNNQKLPSDRVSLENGSILTNSERYSLMIDPQLQGITWVKEREKIHSLRVVRLGTKELTRVLESSIETGNSVLIENMDEQIDAFLMPVICRNTIKKGKSKYIKLGDKELNLSKDFRLYMHTKLSNPHYPPEIQAEATLINFSVTEEGLEDQILNLVVKKERPDLAKQKEDLIQQQNDFKIKLSQLEKSLLDQLTNAQGDILDNVELIVSLENSKKLSEEIKIKVETAKETTAIINKMAENYRPAGYRGSLIFFLMSDLAKVHTFYMYSLESFVSVIIKAIEIVQNENKKKEEEPKKEEEKKETKEGKKEEETKAPAEEEKQEDLTPRSLSRRVEAIIESITSCAWTYIRRGLFEKHKLLVATMLSFRILLRSGKLLQEEVDFLVSGKMVSETFKQPENLKFLNEDIWKRCKSLEVLSSNAFPNFCQIMDSEYMQWKKWFTEEKAESGELPKSVKNVDLFKRLLLLRAMRPDRITYALKEYIKESMGEKYVESPAFDMAETYKDSERKTPLFFVLFPGVDPTAEVERLQSRMKISMVNISMGQGQEEKALNAMDKAGKEGSWVFMQNVHLMQTWLKAFERKLESISETAAPTFRCYISSEPPPIPLLKIIPESILQNCIKIANEAAQDLKGNMRNSFAKFEEDRFKKSTKPNEFKSLLFALCIYHSLILGRRKFGSLGWSRMYNFNDGDLSICSNVLQNYLEKYEKVPYEDLRYIFGEIMYGGHITDEWDRRTNSTYLKVLIRPELLTGMVLCPSSIPFKSPDPTKFEREQYRRYIEEKLPPESPQLFYMHANAEINFLTEQCMTLFDTILEISGGGGGGGASTKKKDEIVKEKINEFTLKLPKSFALAEINGKIKDRTPYLIVCLQECERMNTLLGEIRKSLIELDSGYKGTLNITDAMESLAFCLSIEKVSPTWEKFAYFSKKGLTKWFEDLLKRYKTMDEWSTNLANPKAMWISGLFNPMSFLTAIMQVTARDNKLPLDFMCLQNEVSNFMLDELQQMSQPASGQLIHGLYLEGAKWEIGKENEQGYITEMEPKILHPVMPICNIYAVTMDKKTIAGMYTCPIFFTSARGATFVTSTNLKMESDDTDSNTWILRGAALLMADD